MTLEQIIVFNFALLAALASPGPALLVAIRTMLGRGCVAGLAMGLGLGFMAAIWTLMALLGLNGVFQLFPWAYTAAKTGGALYLLYIAWTTWRGARDPIVDSSHPSAHALRDGVLINLLNPKSVLFAAAVLVVIFPPDMTILQKGVIALNHFAVEVLFYSVLSFLMRTQAVSRRYLRAKAYLDRYAAVILGSMGLRLLVEK